MQQYIDGFAHPVPRIYLEEYKQAAEKIGAIWKEYGAIAYCELEGNDLFLEGTKSFSKAVVAKEDDAVIFGWVVSPRKKFGIVQMKKFLLTQGCKN
jgi:uncharacterized protein YbaA (DUF1428 family)